ncbi:GDSL family lipase [Sphingomonas oleivorans]|uniref:GDSL family lipase n=1 Tax=Sphingomonas oleivorans TaxID=1735121 RepID=A0A2T5FYL9_9SPHN|nr:GDSL-type esterase/lipase family protein [Sphingomonas oleivorans]PTQ11643.1 GDSL family lipase [Sphingomonas oleivorans]
MIAMLAAAAAAAATPGYCDEALCNARTLDPYFEKLATQANPAARRGKPVHILQIGDSHTAGDAITGAWRDLLQARYGGGGRGVLPPGRPYDGFLTRGVQASMSAGWKVSATFGNGSGTPRPPLGLSGFSLTSTAEGAKIGLVADPAQRFDRFVVCAVAQRNAGTLSIRVGNETSHMRLASITTRPECRTIRSSQSATEAQIIAEGGPVTITSVASFRDAGGVALSNLGVVGSQLVHFSRTDDAVLAEELRAYDPDLIVIAFGTNEGFSPHFSPFEYEIVLRTQIGRIRRLAGDVPILLLGAPDASSRRPEMRNNAPGPIPAACVEPRPAPSPRPLAVAAPPPSPPPVAAVASVVATPRPPVENPNGIAAMMAELGLAGEVTIEPEAPPAPLPVIAPPAPVLTPAPAPVSRGPIFPPAGLKAARDVQRRVAASLNLAFWDWEARMGGRCSAVQWVKGTPALMRGDYVHFNSAGGREIGSRLQADLDRAAAQTR